MASSGSWATSQKCKQRPLGHPGGGSAPSAPVPGKDADQPSQADLPPTVTDGRISKRLDQRPMGTAAVRSARLGQGAPGSTVGVPDVPPPTMDPTWLEAGVAGRPGLNKVNRNELETQKTM